MRYLSKLKKKNLSGDICLLRVDLNIEPKEAKYSPRISRIVPTINFLTSRGAKVVIISHRGRPHGVRRPSLSLRAYGKILSKACKNDVYFFPSHDFKKIKNKINHMKASEIILLENLRYLPGEEINDIGLAKKLASFGTMFVNDAFGVVHRKNASVVAITKYLPSYAGFLLEEELSHLSRVMKSPKKPLVVISGGAKVTTKMGLIKYFLNTADRFLIGGAMANTFLKVQNKDIGDSLYEEGALKEARHLLKNEKILLPLDSIRSGGQILDIGIKTRNLFASEIKKAKTIIWNGPLGFIEEDKYAKGTKAIIHAIASSRAFSIVGGGETVELIEKMRIEKRFSFVSTGGGAMLEFLSGRKLSGIEALSIKKK